MSREIFDVPPYSEIWKDTQKREPLSIDKLKAIAVEDEFLLFCDEYEFIEIARAIEKAHGIGDSDD